MTRLSCLRSLCVFMLIIAFGAPLSAQFESPAGALPIFQGPPGARALGIGGAFIGVADDATAAEANPAGLTILSRPEISLHVRSHDIAYGDDDDSAIRPSFASYAAPAGPLVWSIYYTSAIDFDTTSTIQFDPEPGFDIGDRFAFGGPVRVQRFGVAAAFKPFPLLSIGGAVGATRAEVDTGFNLIGPTVFDGDEFLVEVDDRTEGSDTGLSYNLGLLINPGGRFSAGVVYKREPDLQADNLFQGRACFAPCTLAELQQEEFIELDAFEVDVPVPDSYGVGIAFRPFPRGLIALDYSIQSSETEIFDEDLEDFRNTDIEVNTWRVGGEYLIGIRGGNVFIPIRVGYAREEDQDFEFSGNFGEEANITTFGSGIVFGNTELAVSVATGKTITTDDDIRQIIFSAIRRF